MGHFATVKTLLDERDKVFSFLIFLKIKIPILCEGHCHRAKSKNYFKMYLIIESKKKIKKFKEPDYLKKFVSFSFVLTVKNDHERLFF
jgi:hypothetical protein